MRRDRLGKVVLAGLLVEALPTMIIISACHTDAPLEASPDNKSQATQQEKEI